VSDHRTKYVQRIAWNTLGWVRPWGDAARLEANSFAAEKGFAHEEWLFDFDRLIAGWRYGWVQGLIPYQEHDAKPGDIIDIALFTIDAEKRRRWVARIERCEVITEEQRAHAAKVFAARGWLADMKRDVKEVRGKHDNLWFDIRFRPEHVSGLGRLEYVTDACVLKLKRYGLCRADRLYGTESPSTQIWKIRRRAAIDVSTGIRSRRAVPATEYDLVEKRMQSEIAKLLSRKYGHDSVRLEEDSVDIKLLLDDGVRLLELKSAATAHRAIRDALGQLLEYQHRARMRGETIVELIVVGRGEPTQASDAFLAHLRDHVGLSLRYVQHPAGAIDL
jgi:hypothetical protein